jgi:uncharacterized BrkB/YihY/UPF0761 family membrane protein
VSRKRSFRQGWALVKAAVSAWLDDYATSMGAALSYYTVFSLAPLLLIVISIAGLMFGTDAVRGEVFGQLRTRLLSFGMILGIAFLLMVSLVLGAVIAALGKWWGGAFGHWEVLAQAVNTVVGFGLTTSVFASETVRSQGPRTRVMHERKRCA